MYRTAGKASLLLSYASRRRKKKITGMNGLTSKAWPTTLVQRVYISFKSLYCNPQSQKNRTFYHGPRVLTDFMQGYRKKELFSQIKASGSH